MYPVHLIGISLALGSAFTYGSADFFGGLATKKDNLYAVITFSSLIGMIFMGLLAVIRGEFNTDILSITWAGLAGLAGTIGLGILYYGLAYGVPFIVSPFSGVAGAGLPVIYSIFAHNSPTTEQLLGFTAALPAIYLVSQSHTNTSVNSKNSVNSSYERSVLYGLISGIFFGFFFIFLANVDSGSLFLPLAISKSVSFFLGLLFLVASRKQLPNLFKNYAVLLAGVLDSTANGLYLMAVQYTRLDIAAVLASLYPAGTVLLTYLIQKETISGKQWLGIGLCLVAIVLIMS